MRLIYGGGGAGLLDGGTRSNHHADTQEDPEAIVQSVAQTDSEDEGWIHCLSK